MQKISEKVKLFLENPNAIREIMNLMEEYSKIKTEKEIIYLAGGWPQDPPPTFLKEAIEEILKDEAKFQRVTQYGPTRGLTETINSIIQYEKEIFGRDVENKNITIGDGSTELTSSLMEILAHENVEIILSRPHYLNYYRQILLTSNLKVKIKYWNLLKEETKYGPDLEELKEIISDKTSAIILTSPGNPDGQVIDDRLFRGISEIAKDKGIYVIVDLAYRGFCYVNNPYYFSKDIDEHEIFICTFSKELRIPGMRMAYILADRKITKYLEVIRQTSTLCPNNFSQKIIAELIIKEGNLKKIKEFIEKGKEVYEKTAKICYRALREEIPEFDVLEPKGAFYLFFNHKKVMNDSRKFCYELLDKQQVALAPGVDFGLEGWTRLSFAPVVLNNEIIFEGIKRIKETLGSFAKFQQ